MLWGIFKPYNRLIGQQQDGHTIILDGIRNTYENGKDNRHGINEKMYEINSLLMLCAIICV